MAIFNCLFHNCVTVLQLILCMYAAHKVQNVGFSLFHLVSLWLHISDDLGRLGKGRDIYSTAKVQFDSGKCFLRIISVSGFGGFPSSTVKLTTVFNLSTHWHWVFVCTQPARMKQPDHRVRSWANVLTGACEQQGLTGVTGASGGGVGAGTWCTGFVQGSSRAAVETRLTLLTVGSLGVTVTVHTQSWKTKQRSHDSRAVSWICTVPSEQRWDVVQ